MIRVGGMGRPGWGWRFDWRNGTASHQGINSLHPHPSQRAHTHTHTLQYSQVNITTQPASNSPDYDINNSLSDRDLIILSSLLRMSYIGHITALHQHIGTRNDSTPAFKNE